jgi:carbon monoxide dehydrogenase subunit G
MKLEHSFQVAAPLDRVWEALVDVERVAPCLPGAEITEAGEDGKYRGTFSVRLGPTTAAYRGELSMEEVDKDAHRAVMRASGQDKRGQGSAKATIVSTMREEGGATTVDVETDFTITGRLARFGRGGMIQDVSNRLLRDFSECLQKTIEGGEAPPEAAAAAGPEDTPADASRTAAGPSPTAPPAPRAKPVGGISLLSGALFDRIKRVFGALLDRIRRAFRRR